MQFSTALVNKYVAYMKNNHAVCISEEQAQLHLASLSQLYISFSLSKTGDRVNEDLSPRPHPLVGRGERSE